jgi:hypothetical protein
MTIRSKIVALLSGVLLFGIAAAGFSVLTLVRAGDELRLVAEDHVPLMGVLSRVTVRHHEQALRFERALRFGDTPASPGFEKARSEFEDLAAAIWNDIQAGRVIAQRMTLRPNARRPPEGAASMLVLLKRLDRAHNDYAQNARAVFASFEGGRRSEALALAREIEQQGNRFDHAVGSMLVRVSRSTEDASARAKANERKAIFVSSVLSGLAILVAGAAIVFCVRLVSEIKSLTGLLPICATCKRIRDDRGYWRQLEAYLERYSGAEFTHGICEECQKKLHEKMSRGSETPPETEAAITSIRRPAAVEGEATLGRD